jgi:EAL domain-containing protein (putative c-di-GMP-specific phosphodiesterase class I)
MMSPAEFIPIAEETGLIIPIGEWVLRTACAQAVAWKNRGYPAIPMSVNLSGKQFAKPNFITMIAETLRDTGLPPGLLEAEITESALMDNTSATVAKLAELRAMGAQNAIDDFGTGNSSMGYLKRFPINRLKIDQSFVRHIPHDSDDAAITAAIIAMAKTLKITVVAEGVENVDQIRFLETHGCDRAQGYYFSRPAPPDDIARLLEAQHKRPMVALVPTETLWRDRLVGLHANGD